METKFNLPEVIYNNIFKLRYHNSKKNIFLTGIGGTGKSYLIKQIYEKTKKEGIDCALCSTTGISAYNIGGITINSYMLFNVGNFNKKYILTKLIPHLLKKYPDYSTKLKGLEILIIDEISMLGGLYFEMIDLVFKTVRENNKAFGGVQLIFCGDMAQLPPVKDLYPFLSEVWDECKFVNCLLTQPKRFKDKIFSDLLRRIRIGKMTEEDNKILYSRYLAYKELEDTSLFTVILPKKEDVQKINDKCLEEIEGKILKYNSSDNIKIKKKNLIINETIIKEEDNNSLNLEKYFMAPRTFIFKRSAKVLLIKNLNVELGLVNGCRGMITDIIYGDDKNIQGIEINFELDRKEYPLGYTMIINPIEFNYEDDEYLLKRVQFPLILSFSVTVHRCQGLTLEGVITDIGDNIFCAGQAYVALSRCRSLETLYLSSYNKSRITTDYDVKQFEERLLKNSISI